MNAINFLYLLLENREYIALQVLIFLAASLLVGGVIFLLRRRNLLSERMAKLLPSKQDTKLKNPKLFDEESQGGLTAKIINPLHKVIAPSGFSAQHKIRLRLIQMNSPKRR